MIASWLEHVQWITYVIFIDELLGQYELLVTL